VKRALALSIVALLAASCAVENQHYLTDRRFEPVSNSDEVRLFVGAVERPHVEIAYVNSIAVAERTDEARRAQLRSLQDRAAELGANAVMEVRSMKELHKGMVADPAVPVPSWKQGDTTLYFMRGTAIRWDEPDAAKQLEWEEQRAGLSLEQVAPPESTESSVAPPAIPEQQTRDARDSGTGNVRTGY